VKNKISPQQSNIDEQFCQSRLCANKEYREPTIQGAYNTGSLQYGEPTMTWPDFIVFSGSKE
jgi:hypothetical protein